MKIDIYRFSSQSKTTFGAILLDGKFEAYSVEDRYREEKIKHETRIQSGYYEVVLRNFGGHFDRYTQKFDGHEGMLWIKDVPNFTDILFHIGNDELDSSGCVLVVNEINNNLTNKGIGTNSTKAYLRFYFKVLDAFKRNESVYVEIHDLDVPYGC